VYIKEVMEVLIMISVEVLDQGGKFDSDRSVTLFLALAPMIKRPKT
jgi:hypothetical protein